MYENMFEKYLVKIIDGPVNEERLPVLILADVSASMTNAMKDLNDSINYFIRKVAADEKAGNLIDLCIVSFHEEAKVELPWTVITKVEPIHMGVGGNTDITAGLELAEALLTERGRACVMKGCGCKKPLLIFITDGEQTCGESPDEIIRKIRYRVDTKRMMVNVLAVPGYDKKLVADLTKGKAVAELHGSSEGFTEAFDFFAISTKAVSLETPETKKQTSNHTFGNPEEGSKWHKANLDEWLD